MTRPSVLTQMAWEILQGDVLDVLPTLRADSFAGLLTDPPYELGFMGKGWDKSGIAFTPELWAEVYRVLEPGAYLLAFGGTRTWHRLTCAVEDAGFEIRDTLMWLYATGFPKSKACLKPAFEPIVLARKPSKKIIHLNIDGARIKPGAPVGGGHGNFKQLRGLEGRDDFICKPAQSHNRGRWPANVLLDEEAAELLDTQSGIIRGGGRVSPNRKNKTDSIYGKFETVTAFEPYTDSGGASRFFFCTKAGKGERKDNPHTCLKPLKLTTWLASLIKHEGCILIPFSGSGSEMIGAVRAGWSAVVGIERDAEYLRIAERRLRHE